MDEFSRIVGDSSYFLDFSLFPKNHFLLFFGTAHSSKVPTDTIQLAGVVRMAWDGLDTITIH